MFNVFVFGGLVLLYGIRVCLRLSRVGHCGVSRSLNPNRSEQDAGQSRSQHGNMKPIDADTLNPKPSSLQKWLQMHREQGAR